MPIKNYAPPRRSALRGLLAMTAAVAASFADDIGVAAKKRNDPHREKTPQDLERMEAAQRKRERKAARKKK